MFANPQTATIPDACFCGNSLQKPTDVKDEEDEDEDSIYCSIDCARADALAALTARDPRRSVSTISTLSSISSLRTTSTACTSVSSYTTSCEGCEWEILTPPPTPASASRAPSHYRRVQAEAQCLWPDFGSSAHREDTRSCTPRVGHRSSSSSLISLRGTTPIPCRDDAQRTVSQVLVDLVAEDASIIDQYSCLEQCDVLDGYWDEGVEEPKAIPHRRQPSLKNMSPSRKPHATKRAMCNSDKPLPPLELSESKHPLPPSSLDTRISTQPFNVKHLVEALDQIEASYNFPPSTPSKSKSRKVQPPQTPPNLSSSATSISSSFPPSTPTSVPRAPKWYARFGFGPRSPSSPSAGRGGPKSSEKSRTKHFVSRISPNSIATHRWDVSDDDEHFYNEDDEGDDQDDRVWGVIQKMHSQKSSIILS